MSDTSQSPSDFETAARLFEEASAAIDKLREHAATLSNLKNQEGQETAALKESNARLHSAVEALHPIGELGADMVASLRSVVLAAETAFDKETVKGIKDDIARLSEEVVGLRDRTMEERDRAALELAALRERVGSLPGRTRKKHGLA